MGNGCAAGIYRQKLRYRLQTAAYLPLLQHQRKASLIAQWLLALAPSLSQQVIHTLSACNRKNNNSVASINNL
jgi:hypothetical protein